MNLKGRTEFFTMDDVIPSSSIEADFEGQVVVLSEYRMELFKEQYRKPEFQLFLALGGFGTKTYTLGRAVIGKFFADGEECRLNREDFLGVLKPELVKEYELDVEALKNE